MTILSGAGVIGLVTAVAMRQPPVVAVPPGLVAVAACFSARHRLTRHTSAATARGGDTVQPISDRSYAVAYPIVALGVLVGLFAAFLAVHEAGRSINESAIHAAYWAALGAAWLIPIAAQAWRGPEPSEGPPLRCDRCGMPLPDAIGEAGGMRSERIDLSLWWLAGRDDSSSRGGQAGDGCARPRFGIGNGPLRSVGQDKWP